MKGLGKYRVMHCVTYNCRAERDYETWIVEELTNGPFGIGTWWREHREPAYDSTEVIRFKGVKPANEYVERLLIGIPRGTVIKTMVSERE